MNKAQGKQSAYIQAFAIRQIVVMNKPNNGRCRGDATETQRGRRRGDPPSLSKCKEEDAKTQNRCRQNAKDLSLSLPNCREDVAACVGLWSVCDATAAK